MRTRVKICGLTRPEDVAAAVTAGVDALGLVFYPPSPRNVSIEQARVLTEDIPAFVSVVGLFVDADPDWVRSVCAGVPVDLLQFHGDETPEYCEGFGRRYMKALRMNASCDLREEARRYATAAGLLLDADDPAAKGGTGTHFDWTMIPPAHPAPIVLAGGLHPDNIGAALRQVKPYGVDVSSGVEAAKGLKDAAKMAAFIDAVYRFDHGQREQHL